MGLIEVLQCLKEVRQWLNKSHAIKCGKIYAASGLMLAAWNELEGSSTELNSVQPIDWGVNVGAGYDFTDHFSVGVRYYYGLFNVSKYSHDENVGNRVFGVTLSHA